MADLLSGMREVSYKDWLVKAGYSERAAQDLVRSEKQARQKKQLKEYQKRTKKVTGRLLSEFGKEYPEVPPPEGRTWGIWDVFDAFYLLEYPIFNAIKAINEDEGMGDVLKSMLRGLTLQEKTSGDELLESFGMSEGKGRSILGFITEVAGNPLNYLGAFGLTKIGRLAKLQRAGTLKGVKEGSKVGKLLRKMYPGVDKLDEISKTVPKLGTTWAEQAAAGHRVALQAFGKPIVQSEKAVRAMATVGNRIKDVSYVQSFMRTMGHVSNRAAKQLIDSRRWFGEHLGRPYLEEGADIQMFIETIQHPDAKQLIVNLLDDPMVAMHTTILKTDQATSSVLLAPKAAKGIIERTRKVTGKLLSKKAVKLNPELHEAVERVFTTGGYRKGDVGFIVNAVESALGPSMAGKLNVKNSVLTKLLKDNVDDILFNPHFQEEFFGVIAAEPAMKGRLQDVFKAFKYGGGVAKYGDDALVSLWNGSKNTATREVFDDIVKRIYEMQNVPGPMGVLVETGAGSAEIFSYAAKAFLENPSHLLSQSPEMYFFINSMYNVSGVKLPAAFRVTPKLVREASRYYIASRAVSLVGRYLVARGSSFTSPLADDFLMRLDIHMKALQKGDIYKGAYSRLYSLFLGGKEGIKKGAKLKSLLGQVGKDLEHLSTAFNTMDDVVLKKLIRRGVLTDDLATMMKGMNRGDRYLMASRFNGVRILYQPLLDGRHDATLPRTVRSFLQGKSFENAMAVYLTSSVALSEKASRRLAPKGRSIVSVLDAMREGGIHVPEGAYRVAGFMKNRYAKMRDLEKAAGILYSQIAFYYPRFLDEAYRTAYGKSPVGYGGKKFSAKLVNAKRRKLFETVEKINAGVYDLSGDKEKIAREVVDKMFIDDPAVAYVLRGKAHAKAMTNQLMMKDLVKQFGEKVVATTKLSREEAKKFGILDLKGLGKYKISRDIADYVNGYISFATNQADIGKIREAYKTTVSWFRGWTLGIFPQFHVRNHFSNITQNVVSGMNPLVDIPHYSILAHKIQKYGPTLTDEFITTVTGAKISLADIYEYGMQMGVEGTGLFTAEYTEVARQSMKFVQDVGVRTKTAFGHMKPVKGVGLRKTIAAGARAVKGKESLLGKVGQWTPLVGRGSSKLLTAGFLVGRGIENNARWSQFIYSVVEGHSYAEAAQRVAKYLFDYSDVNTVIANMRDYFPFIVWTRKNIPLQIENLVTRSSRVAPLVKMKDTFEEMAGTDDMDTPDLPEFIRENVPLSYRKMKDGTYQYFVLGNWLALTDVERIFSPGDEFFNMLFPGIRIPFELAANKSFFFKSSLERGLPGEEKRFLGLKMNPKLVHVLRAFRVLNEANRLFGLGDDVRESVSQRVLRAALGIKLYPVDPEQESLRRYSSYLEKLGKELSYERHRKKQ